MNQEVQVCVDAKFNVFRDYFDVPPQVQGEMDALFAKVVALGEECDNAIEFEGRFAAELQNEYNGMFLKCAPRAVQMTEEQKAESKRLENEMMYGSNDPKKIAAAKATRTIKDVAGIVATEAEQELIAMKRRSMIEAGTFDEYTRTTNKIDDAVRGAKFIGGLFKKK